MSELATLPVRPVTPLDTQMPDEMVATATVYAKTLAGVIEKQKLYTVISGKRHVRVEGWQLLATMLGLRPNVVWSRPLENGWEARVEVYDHEGAIRGSGEAMCTRDEKEWGPNPTRGKPKDDYAIRSMAQTRAISKAVKGPAGFVVTLAGYETTPAEEMPHELPPAKPEKADLPPSGIKDDPASATEAQAKNIYRLINKIDKDPAQEATRDWLLETLGKNYGTERPAELSRTQAQKVITDLKELAGED